jgi:hypothetical protein
MLSLSNIIYSLLYSKPAVKPKTARILQSSLFIWNGVPVVSVIVTFNVLASYENVRFSGFQSILSAAIKLSVV